MFKLKKLNNVKSILYFCFLFSCNQLFSGEKGDYQYYWFNVYPNPERGIIDGHENSRLRHLKIGLNPWDKSNVIRQNGTPLKDYMDNEVIKAKADGVKLIPRINYMWFTQEDQSDNREEPNPDDIQIQVGNFLNLMKNYSQYIAYFEVGVFGNFGEWHYAFVPPNRNNKWQYFSDKWWMRDVIVKQYINTFPDKFVAVRYPDWVKSFTPDYGRNGYSTSGLLFSSRIGHHNDCFNANETDEGTWQGSSSQIAELKKFQSSDTKSKIMVGEMCPGDNDWWKDQYKKDTVINALKHRRWDALAVSPKLNIWWNKNLDAYKKTDQYRVGDVPLYSYLAAHLGYRFHLTYANLPDNVVRGQGPYKGKIEFINKGWGKLYNTRNTKLVFYNTSTNTIAGSVAISKISDCLLAATPRNAQEIAMYGERKEVCNFEFSVPSTVKTGIYDYFLEIADKDPQLAKDPRYNIRLATELPGGAKMWWDNTLKKEVGWNKLGLLINIK